MSIFSPRLNVFLKVKKFRPRWLSPTQLVRIYYHLVYKQKVNERLSLKQKSRNEWSFEMTSSVLTFCVDVSSSLSKRLLTVTEGTPTEKTWSQNLIYLCQYKVVFEPVLSEQRNVLSPAYLENGLAVVVRLPLIQSIIDHKRDWCRLRLRVVKL